MPSRAPAKSPALPAFRGERILKGMKPALHTLYLPSETAPHDPVVEFLDHSGIGYHSVIVDRNLHTTEGDRLSSTLHEDQLPVLEWDQRLLLENVDLPTLVAFLAQRGVHVDEG